MFEYVRTRAVCSRDHRTHRVRNTHPLANHTERALYHSYFINVCNVIIVEMAALVAYCYLLTILK